MLHHLYAEITKPKRVVILGGNGFIGGAISHRLAVEDIPVLGLGSKELNLMSPDACQKLANLLNNDDVMIFVAAKAPCKDLAMLLENTQMAKSVCEALKISPVAQVIYISSDAVYGDSDSPMTESSAVCPSSIHGVMHLTREVALSQVYAGPLAIVRPTLVYGLDDPHNGYGPNLFRRLAADSKEITLFGNGEELRDHVDVEDIAELVLQIVLHKSKGVINAVSGDLVSFRELAELISASFDTNVLVRSSARSAPMPHNGYRAFDNSAVSKSFPGFKFKSYKEGLMRVNQLFKERSKR
jgi:UDP-glucose 4-epimerase